MERPIITLTTDFGTRFSYVAEMKGVILDAFEGAVEIVDVTHEIRPQSITEAELIVARIFETFPLGTTHVVVVDPGVGTSRRGIAGRLQSHTFVGPDNGVFGGLLNREDASVVELTRRHHFREPVSNTFHGRDIFAPVAAALAGGLELADVGRPIDLVQSSTVGASVRVGQRVSGRIICDDRFGNLLTNIPAKSIDGPVVGVGVGEMVVPFVDTYGHAEAGALVALIGSGGFLEVAACQGSAAKVVSNWQGQSIWVDIASSG